MQLIQKFLLALAFCGVSAANALAAPAAPTAAPPREGQEYTVLAEAQPVPADGKVEVIEFFSYACPHCKDFDPALEAWVKKNADKISFRRVHVAFRSAEQPLQHLYVTLESLGMTEKLHHKIFPALHSLGQRLYTDEAVLDFGAANGIERARLEEAYKSFDVQARLNRANASLTAYNVDHWPMLAIGGRYLTSPSKVATAAGRSMTPEQQHEAGLKVMDFLVAKALPAKAAAKPQATSGKPAKPAKAAPKTTAPAAAGK